MLAQELNPVPFAGILGQTSGQVIYSSVIKNWFIFWANAPGLVLGLWMTLSTIVYATPGVRARSVFLLNLTLQGDYLL